MNLYVKDTLIEVDNIIYILHAACDMEGFEKTYKDYDIKVEKSVVKLGRKISKSKKIDNKKVEFYFKTHSIGDKDLSMSVFLYNPNIFNEVNNFDEYISYIKSLDEKKILNDIYIKMLKEKYGDDKAAFVVNNIGNDKELLIKELIDIDYIEDVLKWSICSVTIDFKAYIDNFINLILSCRNSFSKELEALNSLIREWYTKLTIKVKNEGLSFLEHEFNTIKFNEYDSIYVYPRLIDSSAIDFWYEYKDLYVFLGPYVEDVLKTFGNDDEEQWLLNSLKLLSDDSRLKILDLLKTREMFSGELAEKMNLSNATISHHTIGLQSSNIIKTIRRGSKTYYNINKDTINKLGNTLEKQLNLLEEENEGNN